MAAALRWGLHAEGRRAVRRSGGPSVFGGEPLDELEEFDLAAVVAVELPEG
eukprot:CAMPEP_0176229608 /NCGR_PEP_ID=MMETSP0121_2-20121125/23878_1 /TAXON_ID=160619 /ORGANISM="Kryptoperidinium foliaceum, Strain CCMP 1326" /LENGTH=50 /DNA_ID=CAMNT_0017568939 /DNA_START=70 /DNA_END=219 /DNA_ORIENTATION=+